MIKTSLNKKILALVLGLIVAVIITIGVAVLVSTNQTVYQQANQQLVIGQKVFEKLLDEHGNQLLGSASVLVDDFGFKQAVSSKDAPTIESALENAGLRINADLMLLTDLNGELIAQVSKYERLNRNAVASRVNDTTPQGSYSNIAFVGGRIYQIVLLPVKAPLPIAWVLIGLEIDDAFAAQINSLTNLEVAFQGDGDSGSKRQIVSTLTDGIASSEQMDDMNAFISETTNGFRYMTLNTSLYEGKSGYVRANLHASLDDAYAVFEQLQWQILSISALALLISLIGAMITSRNVTRPVADLVEAAERISGGDYNKKISYTGKPSTEIIALGHSFELMQTQIAEREELLSSQAFIDPLTGIGSRAAMADALQSLIASSQARDATADPRASFALVRLNINRFKEINNTFGYEVGDAVLRNTAEMLRQHAPESQITARLGVDEFAVVLMGLDKQQIKDKITHLSEMIKQPINDHLVAVSSLRFGVATFPEHGTSAEAILRRAEIALSNAKEQKVRIAYYELGQDESHRREIQLVSDLKSAISENKLKIFYQPKFAVAAGRVTQVEALLRWIHEEFGFVSPEEFVALAEQSGQMNRLTEWVIQKSCAQRKAWLDKGLEIDIAINLSAYDLRAQLINTLEKSLKQYDLNTSHIILEITESAFIDDPEQALEILNELKGRGFKLSIDDYGTGYSSLGQLKNLPVDELKIDKSFVLKLDSDENDQRIVRSTLELAKALSLTTVAEGVESLESSKLLKQWGCDKLQGYYFSRPVPPEDFEQWLTDEESVFAKQLDDT